jgi:hypothetical protein
MWINRSILQRLTPSIKEALPESSDAAVRVPPTFNFTGLPPEPCSLKDPTLGATIDTTSAIQTGNQVAAAAGILSTIVLLTPGLWRVNISAAYRSNYTLGTFSGNGNARVEIADPIGVFSAISFWASSLIPTQQSSCNLELLLRSLTTVRFALDTNIAAQEHSLSLGCLFSRLL